MFDRRCINGPTWTLNSGLMHAYYDHHVNPDNLVPTRLLKNSCTSPGILVLMTSGHLHKCNYLSTGFVLLCLSTVIQYVLASPGPPPGRHPLSHRKRTPIGTVVAMPQLTEARIMI